MPQDPYRYFRVEARELLDALSSGLNALQRQASPEQLAQLLRSAHTLKGAARVVRQARMAELAHELEDLLAPFRQSDSPVPADAAAQALERIDELSGILQTLGPGEGQGEPARAAPPPTETRLDMRSLDGLLESAYAAAALLERAARDHPEDRLLERARGEVHFVVERASELRLQPVQLLFSALERAARDSAAVVGKRVTFELAGGELRLDPHALAPIGEALGHLVRNAVVHGIEPGEERARLGKGPGRVWVEARREGRALFLTVGDDGAGMDLDALRRAAVARRLVSADEAGALPAERLIELAFAPGLSTDTAAGAVSGRGVGLDAARARIAGLGGSLSARTERGKGTTFVARVPVSVYAHPVVVVEDASGAYGIPLTAVLETRRIQPSDLAVTGTNALLAREGGAIPYARLDALLGAPARGDARSAVVVQGRAGAAAVGVRQVRGVEDVIARPVPELAGALPLVSGFSVDAAGVPRAILVADALAQAAATASAPAGEKKGEQRRPPVLVVDDSLTTRMLERSILEAAGYDVELAVGGEEALARAAARPHSLFLVDIEMPWMDGFELMERLRADARLAKTPVVLVTSLGSPQAKARGMELGADAYVVKSEFDQESFLALVRRLAR